MGNSGWTADKLNFTLPPGAVPPQTFIYIGDADGDPYGALTVAGLDAGLVFYFGTPPYSFVFGLFQEVGFNDGHLYIAGVDPITPRVTRLLETDYAPTGGGMFAEIGDSINTMFYESNATEIHATSAGILLDAGGTISLGDHTSFPGTTWPTNIDGEFYIRNNEVGWGIWMSVGSQSSSAAIGTTETVVLTLPSKTYEANRSYRVTIHSGVSVTTAGSFADMRLKKTNTAGQTLSEFFRTPCPVASTVYAQHAICEFTTGANAVTAALVITLAASAGTVVQFGSATAARTATVEDIGSAGQITPTASVLV